MYFYLGGTFFPEYMKNYLKEISVFPNYREKVIHLGYIDDEDVNILYSNSLFFTYLSQYEGFGIPPLEAMQAGTPVICSNNSSLPEVAGDAAITIGCNDKEACIKAFENLYFNENIRKEHIKKGFERAKQFSWENTFNNMSKIIQDVVC
jgi:glycosyltransferase involved in cell wall biosynthesis